jgi:hypothetical protein
VAQVNFPGFFLAYSMTSSNVFQGASSCTANPKLYLKMVVIYDGVGEGIILNIADARQNDVGAGHGTPHET